MRAGGNEAPPDFDLIISHKHTTTLMDAVTCAHADTAMKKKTIRLFFFFSLI